MPVTPGRPSAWSRTVPTKLTTAPHSGRTAHSSAAAMGRRLDVRPTQSSPLSGGFTPSWYGPRGGGDASSEHLVDNLALMTVESGDFEEDHDGPESSEDPPNRPWRPQAAGLRRHPHE